MQYKPHITAHHAIATKRIHQAALFAKFMLTTNYNVSRLANVECKRLMIV